MQVTTIQRQIRSFISDSFLFGQSESLKDTESFLESGILDSTGILQLVAYLEVTYGIIVADSEVIPDNLDSVARVSAYVKSKMGRSADRPSAALLSRTESVA